MTNRTQMTLKELISADTEMKPDKEGFLPRLNGIHLRLSAVLSGTFPDAGRGNGIYLRHLPCRQAHSRMQVATTAFICAICVICGSNLGGWHFSAPLRLRVQ